MAMNGGAPTCPTCGGVSTNPQATQCRFCGQTLAPHGHVPPQGFAAPQGYAASQAHGAPHGYGAPQSPYAAPPGGYGAPHAYGQPPAPYGGPQPNPYGAPQPNPYGAPHVPVAGFGGVQPYHQGYVKRSGWSSGWSAFFWIRLALAAIAISLSLIGACVSAIAH